MKNRLRRVSVVLEDEQPRVGTSFTAHHSAPRATNKRTDACFRPLSYTLKFFAYKKYKNLKKDYLFFTQLFSADATMFSIIYFSSHKKLKKPTSKVAHNQPKPRMLILNDVILQTALIRFLPRYWLFWQSQL